MAMSPTQLTQTMSAARQWLLVVANLILAAAVSVFVFGRGGDAPESDRETPLKVAVDLDPLLKPIESLEESLEKFSSTLQRFNTTVVQYDFLQKDIQRLVGIEQAVAMRLNQELQNKAQLGEETNEPLEKGIEQLQQFQEQVQKELEQRRQLMLQLIAGLEQNLAASGVDDTAVREVLGDAPIPSTPDPNLDNGIPATPTTED